MRAFSGLIKGVGPRYCPSIEDKLVKFADRDSHQIFLEPEGLNTDVVYPNGISTSLPADVQEAFIHTVKGLENVRIIRYAYAIEYDYVDPQELDHCLQLKRCRACSLPDRLTVPPAMKKPLPRDCWPALTLPSKRKAKAGNLLSTVRKPISA